MEGRQGWEATPDHRHRPTDLNLSGTPYRQVWQVWEAWFRVPEGEAEHSTFNLDLGDEIPQGRSGLWRYFLLSCRALLHCCALFSVERTTGRQSPHRPITGTGVHPVDSMIEKKYLIIDVALIRTECCPSDFQLSPAQLCSQSLLHRMT